MDDAVLRPYREGDEAAINDGFNRVFNLARGLEEWRWKFQVAPFGRYVMLLVGGDGRVLAHYGAVPVRIKAGEVSYLAGQIVDVYSASDARGSLATARTLLKTVDSFFDTYCGPNALAVCYGFPSARHLKLGVMRAGYSQVPPQQVTLWRRPTDRRGRLFNRHAVREGFSGRASDELWTRARSRYALGAERDGAWLGRRFAGRPGVEYLHLSAWRRGQVAAAAVLRLTMPGASWADLVWDGEDDRALAALDRAGARAARAAGAVWLEMWLDGDPAAARVLEGLGWQGGPHPLISLAVRSWHPAIDPATVPGRFLITMSDADLV